MVAYIHTLLATDKKGSSQKAQLYFPVKPAHLGKVSTEEPDLVKKSTAEDFFCLYLRVSDLGKRAMSLAIIYWPKTGNLFAHGE
jgi:hypothetical protein